MICSLQTAIWVLRSWIFDRFAANWRSSFPAWKIWKYGSLSTPSEATNSCRDGSPPFTCAWHRSCQGTGMQTGLIVMRCSNFCNTDDVQHIASALARQSEEAMQSKAMQSLMRRSDTHRQEYAVRMLGCQLDKGRVEAAAGHTPRHKEVYNGQLFRADSLCKCLAGVHTQKIAWRWSFIPAAGSRIARSTPQRTLHRPKTQCAMTAA